MRQFDLGVKEQEPRAQGVPAAVRQSAAEIDKYLKPLLREGDLGCAYLQGEGVYTATGRLADDALTEEGKFTGESGMVAHIFELQNRLVDWIAVQIAVRCRTKMHTANFADYPRYNFPKDYMRYVDLEERLKHVIEHVHTEQLHFLVLDIRGSNLHSGWLGRFDELPPGALQLTDRGLANTPTYDRIHLTNPSQYRTGVLNLTTKKGKEMFFNQIRDYIERV